MALPERSFFLISRKRVDGDHGFARTKTMIRVSAMKTARLESISREFSGGPYTDRLPKVRKDRQAAGTILIIFWC
jgi:hypothetical protein